MPNNKKVHIGKYEYIIMEDQEENEYLYRYDMDYGVGIKLKFTNETREDTKENLKNMLMNIVTGTDAQLMTRFVTKM